MKYSPYAFLFLLLTPFLWVEPGWCSLPFDENIGILIQAMAKKNGAEACIALGIPVENAGNGQIQKGVEALGGKNIDEITRTQFQYNWNNGYGTLNAVYHIRCANEGYDLAVSLETVDKKVSSFDLRFGKGEANPWEVQASNLFYYHWGVLLLVAFLTLAAAGLFSLWLIRRLEDKKLKTTQT